MSVVHLTQLKAKLKALFEGKLNVSDTDGSEAAFLSRALASYVAYSLSGDEDLNLAIQSITDGGDDNGVDAIYISETEKTLFLIQSKWSVDGSGAPDSADVKKFTDGVKDLFNLSFERFNSKIKQKKDLIEKALSDAGFRYRVVLAHSGSASLGTHAARDLGDLKSEINDTSEVLSIDVLGQSELYRILTSGNQESIELEIGLQQWGRVVEPNEAFYGQVSAVEVRSWWDRFGSRLFSKNLRGTLGDTEVNREIQETLINRPKDFWFFNNGITIIAGTVAKAMAHAGSRDNATIKCTAASIVNGAQTVSAIGRIPAEKCPMLEEGKVQVRIISLQAADGDYGSNITRTNNRQNRVENRDFVALDPFQVELRNELGVEGVEYIISRTELSRTGEVSFDLVEATSALACASGQPALVVQLKREIGKLWEDITKTPYKTLFNPANCPSHKLWRLVRLQRLIESQMKIVHQQVSGRENGILVHGNRFISSVLFSRLVQFINSSSEEEFKSALERIREPVGIATKSLLTTVNSAITARFSSSAILPTLFKNSAKCTTLYNDLKSKAALINFT